MTKVQAWPPCERAVDTGLVLGRDEERVPGTGPCKGPSYITADHPAIGGTIINHMGRYVGSILEPAIAWVCPRHG